MKLHLPKMLMTAVIAITALSAAQGAITTTEGTPVDGVTPVTVTFTNNSQDINFDNYTDTAEKTYLLLFDTTSSGNNFFRKEDCSTDVAVQIGRTDNGQLVSGSGLYITNGYSGENGYREYGFGGTITGAGEFKFSTTTTANYLNFIFSGNMSAYTGNMTLDGTGKQNKLTFNGNTSGTGTITALGSNSVVVNGATMKNSSIQAGNLSVSGTSTFAGDVEAKTLTVSNGEATFEKAVNLAQNGTIILNGGTTTFTALKAHSAGNSITVQSGATLNAVTKSEGSGAITLKGSGIYNLGTSVQSNVTGLTANTWTGTVVVNGATGGLAGNNNTGIAVLGHSGSKVELKNCSGYITASINSAIILTDVNDTAALTITDGSSANGDASKTMATFNGAISGSGTIKINWNKDDDYNTGFTFNGDLSGWNGAFEQTNDKTFTVFLTGAANTVNASIKNTSGGEGFLYLDVNTTNDATFSQAVTVDKVTLKKNASFTNTLTTKELKIGSGTKATVSGADGSSAAVLKSTGDGGKVGVDAETGAAYIHNMELTNAKIAADAAATHVYLQNVTGNATLGVGTYGLQVSKAEAAPVAEGDNIINYTIAAPQLTLSDAGAKLLISASPLTDAQNSSGALTLNFSGLNVANATGQDDWSAFISFGGELGEMLDKQGWEYAQPELSSLAAVDAEKALVSLGFTGNNLTSITISNLNIPEPATATLSLLALAAMAARRRRK